MAPILLGLLTFAILMGIVAGLRWSHCHANREGRRNPEGATPRDAVGTDAFEGLVGAIVRRKRLAALVVGAWAAVVGLTTLDPVFDRMPHVWQRGQSAVFFGLIASGLLFAGAVAVTVARAARRREARALLVAFALGCVVLVVRVRKDYSPVTLMPPRLAADGTILQSHGATCAAASLANLVRLRGGQMSEREAVDLLGTSTSGTDSGQIRFALKRLGIGFRTPERTERLEEVGGPAFLFVDHPAIGTESHAVLLAGVTAEGYEILDPLTGREFWDAATLQSRWHGSAIACP